MRRSEFQFIDAVIDPIPVFGQALADLFYTWAGLADAMNLRHLSDPVSTLPPGDNMVQAAQPPTVLDVRKAA